MTVSLYLIPQKVSRHYPLAGVPRAAHRLGVLGAQWLGGWGHWRRSPELRIGSGDGAGHWAEVLRAAHRLRGVGGTGRRSPQSRTGWGELGALAEDSPQPRTVWGELGALAEDSPQPHTGWGELGALALASPKPRTGLGELGALAEASPEPRTGWGELGALALASPEPRIGLGEGGGKTQRACRVTHRVIAAVARIVL